MNSFNCWSRKDVERCGTLYYLRIWELLQIHNPKFNYDVSTNWASHFHYYLNCSIMGKQSNSINFLVSLDGCKTIYGYHEIITTTEEKQSSKV